MGKAAFNKKSSTDKQSEPRIAEQLSKVIGAELCMNQKHGF